MNMKKFFICFVISLGAVNLTQAQDLLVTNDGKSLNVYNIEMGTSYIFYQLSEDPNSEIRRISKTDVLIIKKADGTKIDPSSSSETPISNNTTSSQLTPQRNPLTAIATSTLIKDKNGISYFSAKTPDGKELHYQILSESDKNVSVIKGKYKDKHIVIPEYVVLNNTRYCVTNIGNECFDGLNDIEEIELPLTLIQIGDKAFRGLYKLNKIDFPIGLKEIGKCSFMSTWLESIILPEGLETIGEKAFFSVRYGFSMKERHIVKEIYIPKTVKSIGVDCFRQCGKFLSPKKKYQGVISCIPSFVTVENCDEYGIDDFSIRSYIDKNKREE